MQYRSIIKDIESVFRNNWDAPALANYGSSSVYSYGEVAAAVEFFHSKFREIGIRPGDKVVVCDKNYRNWIIAMLSVITYKAVGVPLLPDFSESQIVSLCEHSEAKFIFCNEKFIHLWDEGKCPMYIVNLSELPYERFSKIIGDKYGSAFGPENVNYTAENPDDLMLLSYTSGSTGNPKGVMLSFASLRNNVDYMFSMKLMPVHGNALIVLPLAHMFGFVTDFMTDVLCAAKMTILTSAPIPSVLVQAISDVKPDVMYSVPLLFEKIVSAPARDKLVKFLNDSSIQEIIMGGAGLNWDVEQFLRKSGVRFSVGYGMTESGPLISHTRFADARPGSCGKAVIGMEIKVLSSDPVNVPGEVICRGKNLMVGYYKNESASGQVIDSDGWLHTGDLGVIDSDGYLYLRGRKKNMMLSSNGLNIYPEEIEEQIVIHSIFDECVVVQRKTALVALVYVSPQTLLSHGLTFDIVASSLEEYRKEVNVHLPNFAQISALELRAEEFEKTPKKNIRRFLYQ